MSVLSLSSFTCGQNYTFSDLDATDSRDSRTCKLTHHLAARLQLAASTRATTATKHGRLSIPPSSSSSRASLPQQKTRRLARDRSRIRREIYTPRYRYRFSRPARQTRRGFLVLSVDRAKSVTIQRRRNRARARRFNRPSESAPSAADSRSGDLASPSLSPPLILLFPPPPILRPRAFPRPSFPLFSQLFLSLSVSLFPISPRARRLRLT